MVVGLWWAWTDGHDAGVGRDGLAWAFELLIAGIGLALTAIALGDVCASQSVP